LRNVIAPPPGGSPAPPGVYHFSSPAPDTEGWPAGGQRTPLDAVEQFSGAGIPDRAQEGAHPGSFTGSSTPVFPTPKRRHLILPRWRGPALSLRGLKFPAASEPLGTHGKQGGLAYYFASAGIVFSMALPVGGSIVAKLSPAFFQAPRPPSM
jgi:hypothetical protein